MLLLVNVCKYRLHYFEFVKPIEEILKKNEILFKTVHYSKINTYTLQNVSKIIICGTSLKDMNYLGSIDKLHFIKKINIPVLGICAGMQVMCKLFGCKIVNGLEIGQNSLMFDNFLARQTARSSDI